MAIGAGVLEGVDVDRIIGIRPDDDAYAAHSGAVFNAQTTSNVPFYEIQAAGDQIDFDLGFWSGQYDEPRLVIYTAWGTTDFQLVDRDDSSTIIDESSGFDTDSWIFSIELSSPSLRLTQFDDTQAAFLPYVGLFDAVV